MSKVLRITRFGNPILRANTKKLTVAEILSDEIQALVINMRYTLVKKNMGIGLAAPQVGKNVALSVISLKPTPTRPDLKTFDMTIINPQIIETYGKRKGKWEGCISCGAGLNVLYALVPRYEKIKLRWLDEKGANHEKIFSGCVAHVAQHETDHLKGILFVDKVKDPSTFMMADEYQKRIVKNKGKAKGLA
jgi:peptide deformylase